MASDQTVHSSRLSDLDFAAQFIEPTHESQDRLGAVATGEVLSAEVLVFDLVLEHMPDGGEDRSGHREDGFLRAAASLEAQKLSLQVELPLVRTAAHAAVTSAVLSQGAPLRVRVERRSPSTI